jgi:glucose/arabinose dehydrogenase
MITLWRKMLYAGAIVVSLSLLIYFGSSVLNSLFNKTANQTVITPSVPTNTKETQDIPQISTVATGIEVPWAIAFLPDNSMLVTERPGRVRRITNDGKLLPEIRLATLLFHTDTVIPRA